MAKVKPVQISFTFTALMQPSTGFTVMHAGHWIGTAVPISKGVWHAYAARADLDLTQEFPTREAAAAALLNATK